MSVFPGTNIPTNASSRARVNEIVDNILTPRLMEFRQLEVRDERFTLLPDNISWKATFGNWLQGYDLAIRKNGKRLPSGPGGYNWVNWTKGTLETGVVDVGPDNRPRDTVEGTYQFDYFSVDVLEGFLIMSVDVVNTSASGPPTSYTIDNMPAYWNGVVSDLAFAVCMERLILDYDLWKPRTIFVIGPSNFEEASDSGVVSQLETLKTNAEERANRTLENEKFKSGNYLSAPTGIYYAAVQGVGGYGRGCVGGKWRGLKVNDYV